MITYPFQEIGKGLEFYTSNYGKILLIGDFNSEMSETSLISSEFLLQMFNSGTDLLQKFQVPILHCAA